MKKVTIAAFAVFSCLASFGQVTQNNNNPVGGNFLGFNNTSLIDLPLENNGVRTVYSFENWTGLNGLSNSNANRIAVPVDPTVTINPIFSMMHLGDNTNPMLRRPWMNVGTSYIESGDLMYVGLMERPVPGSINITDAVIGWGCNDDFFAPAAGPDNLRFLFLSPTDTGAPDAASQQGRETMRITPNGNIGMGAVFSNAQQPLNRLEVNARTPQLRLSHTYNSIFTEFETSEDGNLHILPQGGAVNTVAIGFLDNQQSDPIVVGGIPTTLDVGGLTRIRNLPFQGDNDCLILGTRAPQSTAADNFLKRLQFTGNSDDYLAGDGTWQSAGINDCRWEDAQSGTIFGNIDLRTGFNPASECYRDKVVIGANGAKEAKLESWSREDRDKINRAIYARAAGAGESSSVIFSGIIAETEGTAGAINSVYVGAFGNAGYIGEYGRQNIGVRGEANADQGGQSIGVYAKAEGLGQQIALYAEGNIATLALGIETTTMFPITVSDALLKNDINTIEDATYLLNQLSPKTYEMTSPENRNLYLGEGINYGLIAQEVQEVIPSIVKEVNIPAKFDSTGVIEGSNLDLLGVQYEALIPILVAGFQEQNVLITDQAAMITEQEEENEELLLELNELKTQMTEMQNQMTEVMASFQSTQSKMNNCCGTAPNEKSKSETGVRLRSPSGDVNLEQNFPNPFEDITTINFSINEPAQIRLEISDSQGRVLDVLVNQRMEKGEYSERWDGSAVAPGTYYYSLYADTELLTKKMIKR